MTEQYPGKTHVDFTEQLAEHNHSVPQKKKKKVDFFFFFFNLDFINISVSPRTGTF